MHSLWARQWAMLYKWHCLNSYACSLSAAPSPSSILRGSSWHLHMAMWWIYQAWEVLCQSGTGIQSWRTVLHPSVPLILAAAFIPALGRVVTLSTPACHERWPASWHPVCLESSYILFLWMWRLLHRGETEVTLPSLVPCPFFFSSSRTLSTLSCD